MSWDLTCLSSTTNLTERRMTWWFYGCKLKRNIFEKDSANSKTMRTIDLLEEKIKKKTHRRQWRSIKAQMKCTYYNCPFTFFSLYWHFHLSEITTDNWFTFINYTYFDIYHLTVTFSLSSVLKHSFDQTYELHFTTTK